MDALGIDIKTAEDSQQEKAATSKQVGRPKLNDTDIENDNTGTSND
jgi:hypothetical protein